MQVELKIAHLERMLIPKDYWYCTLDQIDGKRSEHKPTIVHFVENIIDNVRNGRGLLLYGNYSTGKSGCGSILLKAAAANGYIGMFLRTEKLPEYFIKGTMFDKEFSMVDRAASVPLLVIDELILFGDKRDWYVESLVRDRVNEKLSTIITTNLAVGTIMDKYPAFAAVLKEATTTVLCKGEDFRSEIASKNALHTRPEYKK